MTPAISAPTPPVPPACQDYFHLHSDTFLWGFIASSMTVGAIVGSGTAGLVSDALGRRWTVVAILAVYAAGVALEVTATSLSQLLVGRVCGVGVAVGALSNVVPVFIAELAPGHLRGALVTVNQLAVCVGILAGFVATLAFPSWRAQLATGLPFAGVLVVFFVFFAPESPRWLVAAGRRQAALNVLLRLRGPHLAAEAQGELDGIEASLHGPDAQAPVGCAAMEPHLLRALAVGVGLSAVQQVTGVQVTNYFAQDVYRDAGFSEEHAKEQAIYIGVAKVAMVCVAFLAMDRLGRKKLLVGGVLLMAAAVAALGTIFTVYDPQAHAGHAGPASYAAAACLIVFMSGFELGAGPVVWVLLSELFPQRVRGVSMGVGAMSNWAFNFATGLFFPVLRKALGISGVFFLFASVAAAGAVWVAAVVPETKGLRLEEVEELFRSGRGWCAFDSATRQAKAGTTASLRDEEHALLPQGLGEGAAPSPPAAPHLAPVQAPRHRSSTTSIQ